MGNPRIHCAAGHELRVAAEASTAARDVQGHPVGRPQPGLGPRWHTMGIDVVVLISVG